MGGSDYSRHWLVEESLLRIAHPPREVGDLVPTRSDGEPCRACSSKSADVETAGRVLSLYDLGQVPLAL